uniref:Protein kinase domain-containing protein n=1 Tax=Leersia perrieri TaxID=77586 RepID=A0A0D9XH91_9ORYZ
MTSSTSSFCEVTIAATVFQFLVTMTLAKGLIALPGCPESCGGIQVPYPFGIGDKCSYNGFNLTCDDAHQMPKLFMAKENGVVEVLNISLLDGTNSMLNNLSNSLPFTVESVPVVLEWWLDLIRDEALLPLSIGPNTTDFRCLSLNSSTYYNDLNYDRRRCNCSQGYEGNPYIRDGCQDIDECKQPDIYPCHGTCINMPGTYRCFAKISVKSLPGLITIIAVSAGFGLLSSLLCVAKITSKIKRRRTNKLRRKYFKKNHGLLLQQLISSNRDIAERMKIFSLEELDQATNSFDQNRILGGGGHGTVYKGILSDQHVVAIKKSKIVVQREINDFINEVVILSQTNHRNVVKLYGCCLETEVPLLVYEFISNGTLSLHLHGQNENPLIWKDRLRIALETARAIAYLHSAASISVLHRDIKSANILLTDTMTAKVSDFGASRDNRLSDIMDPQIVDEVGAKNAEVVGKLAEACLRLKGEERPTMRQVETTLEDVQRSQVQLKHQIARASNNTLKDQTYKGNKCYEGTRQYSLENEFIQSSEFPR